MGGGGGGAIFRIFTKVGHDGSRIQTETGHDRVMFNDIIGHRGVNHEIKSEVGKCKNKLKEKGNPSSHSVT